jgi:hypothetical protein
MPIVVAIVKSIFMKGSVDISFLFCLKQLWVLCFVEEADRLLRGNQKLAPFLPSKESCLQREKEKG